MEPLAKNAWENSFIRFASHLPDNHGPSKDSLAKIVAVRQPGYGEAINAHGTPRRAGTSNSEPATGFYACAGRWGRVRPLPMRMQQTWGHFARRIAEPRPRAGSGT